MSNNFSNIIEEAKKYQRKCEVNARAHFLLWENNSKWNKRLGIPVIILTTLVGSTLFASRAIRDSLLLEIVLGSMSLVAAILSALQITLRLADEAEKFKAAGLRYRSMVRQFDLFLFKYSDRINDMNQREKLHIDFKDLIERLDDLASESPSIKDRMYFKALLEIDSD
ncbi:MAG: hypothetical protein COB12_04790 [Flavobacterium sp.]|nr:MAG: hypothetical protein COB12_04790 [Flavobacterium sp.]